MVKFWNLLFFLVLAILSLSKGQFWEDQNRTDSSIQSTSANPNFLPNETELATTSPQNRSSANAATTIHEQTQDTYTTDTNALDDTSTNAAEKVPVVPDAGLEDDFVAPTTTVPPTAAKTSPAAVMIEEKYQTSWGYVILVLIIIVIVILSIILYSLRRASRTYSFDLQRPVTTNHHSEPTGTFGAVYLDDLAPGPALEDHTTPDDLAPPPAVNGTGPQLQEKGTNGEKAPEEEKPESNGLTASVTGDTSPTLGNDPADRTSSPVSSTDLLFEAAGMEQHNENNNNPLVCSSDPFVEINLDDPAWCDQLLTSPEATSSVLPFSSFSFCSTTSSS